MCCKASVVDEVNQRFVEPVVRYPMVIADSDTVAQVFKLTAL